MSFLGRGPWWLRAPSLEEKLLCASLRQGHSCNVSASLSPARDGHLSDRSHSLRPGVEVTEFWVLIPALPLASCESFVKSLNLSVLQILYL